LTTEWLMEVGTKWTKTATSVHYYHMDRSSYQG
jgi:hypothetical protein